MLVLATARPRSACGHAAFEVAQETAHAPAAASEPPGGGDGGLVRLDVGVVLVPHRPARRGAGRRRRGPGVGSEERGVVVVAGGHGGVTGVASSGVRGAPAASRSGGGRECERERGRRSGGVDECEGGVSVLIRGGRRRRRGKAGESESARHFASSSTSTSTSTAVMNTGTGPHRPTGRADGGPARWSTSIGERCCNGNGVF